MRISINGGSASVMPVGSGAAGCTAGTANFTCVKTITIAAASQVTVSASGYGSANGSGAALEFSAPISVAAQAASAVVTPTWKPVVAALSTSLNGRFAAGIPSNIGVMVSATDAAGFAIPSGAATLLDASGAAITIGLSDSDASKSTLLASNTYSGNSVALAYDGNLPLPKPITITAMIQGGATAITAAPVSVVQPTASKNFTFTFGGQTTVVQNNTGIPTDGAGDVDWWNQIPDSKIAIVNLGSQSLISWGNGAWAVAGNSPYPESVQGTSYVMYNPASVQNFEQAGWWFRDVLPLNNPYHPSDTRDLIAFYHAEADYTGPHTKTVAVSYSHDSGKSWTKGAQILTPNGYAAGTGISSADQGAIYDPVNKRWVIFFTAVDPSANISGALSEAISNDPAGAPGTWFKLFQGGFTQPGLQGQEDSLAAVQDQGYISSPTISWNTYLNEWVMIADWGDVGEALMVSPDLYTWSVPVKLMDGTNLGYAGGTSAYPTLVGDHDDKITGQTSHLYFAEFSTVDSRIYGRIMLEQALTFQRND